MIAAGLLVVRAGLHTTVQDLGRSGFRDVGVPTSGPLDRVALRLANALVGNWWCLREYLGMALGR